ncbi:hypothetical protein EP331_05910 [bacterium]|nr:MAG: hypothetical protein EP331_05910 [bacterium]
MISAEQKLFIDTHKNQPKAKLALLLSKLPIQERSFILDQINGYQKGKEKLPLWVDRELLFPPSINLEQCSSEKTAHLKLDLFDGKTLLDLTGGFGVDSTLAAKNGFTVTHVEPNLELQHLVQENAKKLELTEFYFENSTAEHFLHTHKTRVFDSVLIDPSRRDEHNRKLVSLHDCVPNVLKLLPVLKNTTSSIVLKLSPMLDIHKAVSELEEAGNPDWFIHTIRVVSVKNECKELVIKLKKKSGSNISLQLWNSSSEHENQTFETKWPLHSTEFRYSAPLSFLYDVHASIHKAQAYSPVCEAFELHKLAPQTHVFTSEKHLSHFPGRVFRVIETHPYKKGLSALKANIVPRNFPDSESEIRKKTGLQTGDDYFVFAVKDNQNKPILIVCQSIS